MSGPADPPIRLALVDDHPVLRESMAQLAAGCADIVVVAEGATGRDAIEIARRHAPDVMLMDLVMPGQGGLDALGHVKALAPATGVLIFSAYPEQQFGVSAMRAGASGYLSKQCSVPEILEAVRSVARGKLYITRSVAALLAEQFAQGGAPHETLSGRELQVLLRVARGQSTSAIARELSLSVKSVSTHRAHMMHKLGLHSASDATYYAVKHGLLG